MRTYARLGDRKPRWQAEWDWLAIIIEMAESLDAIVVRLEVELTAWTVPCHDEARLAAYPAPMEACG